MTYEVVVNNSGVIGPQPLNPSEKFLNSENLPISDKTIGDYWQWAFSDLIGNTERGVIAEYLVAMASGSERPVRNSWEPYDIQSTNGKKIEVKSAAYVQSWAQSKPSQIRFSIRKTLEWVPEENRFGKDRKRHSDLYVFCVLTEKIKSEVNPLDIEQWEFYIMSTQLMDKELADSQSISLATVLKYSQRYTFKQLNVYLTGA